MNKKNQEFFKRSVNKFADKLYKKLYEMNYSDYSDKNIYTVNFNTDNFEDDTTIMDPWKSYNTEIENENIPVFKYKMPSKRTSPGFRGHLCIFSDHWPLLKYYQNNVFVNGKHVQIFDNGYTKDNYFDPDQIYNVTIRDINKVTTCERMFSNTDIIECPEFNTSNVSDMSEMFMGSRLEKIKNLDTSNVTNMDLMFAGTYIVSVPEFDTSNVETIKRMFKRCDRLKSVPLFNLSSLRYPAEREEVFDQCNNISPKTKKVWGNEWFED